MIYINRSCDDDGDVAWVANNLDGARNYSLYVGRDVNGAVAAAVAAGLPKDEALAQVKRRLEILKEDLAKDQANDELRS